MKKRKSGNFTLAEVYTANDLPSYMREIYKYTKGEWTLIHSWYVDDFGFKRNDFQVYKIKNGLKIIYPFNGIFRSFAYPNCGDNTTPYKKSEYKKMLEEQIEKIND